MKFRRRRVAVCVAGLLWSVAVAFTIIATRDRDLVVTLFVCIVPGVMLFVVCLVDPSTVTLASRTAAAVLSLGLYYRSWRITPNCSSDGFCGTDVYVALLADIVTFGVLRAAAELAFIGQHVSWSAVEAHRQARDGLPRGAPSAVNSRERKAGRRGRHIR